MKKGLDMEYLLTGKIDGLSIDFATGKAKLSIEVNEKQSAISLYDKLQQDEKLTIQIKKYRKKRSINANALCWALCTEIANILRTDKDSVYLDMLKSYGQSSIVSVLSEIDVKGFFRYYEMFGNGTVNGKEFTHYKVFKGSSEYDTREMAILIDGIISEAKSLGIETMNERELSLIKNEWGK